MISSVGDLAGSLADCADQAADFATRDYDDKADENAITDQFIGSLKTIIASHDWGDSVVRAERVRDRGPGAVEKRTGADFVLRYKFRSEHYSFKSGILLQAKHYTTYDDDISDLKIDCEKMMRHTSACYLVTYSPSSFYHFPANALLGLEKGGYEDIEDKQLHRQIHYRETRAFYNRFFRGMIGDPIVHVNWDYFMENSDHYVSRPRIPDGGEEQIIPVEGGPGLEIVAAPEEGLVD